MTYPRTPVDSPWYDAHVRRLGYVPNYVRVFALAPEASHAWQALTPRSCRDERARYDLVTLVAARRLNAPYCVLAHTAVLRDWLDDRQMLDAIVADPHYAGLDPAEVAIMDFVERLLVDPAAASEADAEALPRHEPSTPQR